MAYWIFGKLNFIGSTISNSKSLDIDNSFDFEIVEFLMEKKINLKKNLDKTQNFN